MKPGRRRLLIPGLLIALLIVVALAAAIRRADTNGMPTAVVPHVQVSEMTDPRITESSGLAASRRRPGIVYTINDSGSKAQVFVVDIATGDVIGVTTVRNVGWVDTEALALHNGTLWIADTGNNSLVRQDLAIYAIAEPSPGDHVVDAVRYGLTFPSGAVNIESMAVVGGRIELYTKAWPNGVGYVLPRRLSVDSLNAALVTAHVAPSFASDAVATPDGRYVLVRTAASVEVRDAVTWRLLDSDAIPPDEHGESITVESSGRSYLLGNEGSDSRLVRVEFSAESFTADARPIDAAEQLRAAQPVRWFLWKHRFAGAAIVGLVLTGAFVLSVQRRRRAKASPETT